MARCCAVRTLGIVGYLGSKGMKAAEFLGPGRIGISECDVPEARPGWVRLAVSAVGICGTDLHLLGGFMGSEGLRPGHEIAGIVDADRRWGRDTRPGRRWRWSLSPRAARASSVGPGTTIVVRIIAFSGVTTRGGMADYLTVPASCLHLLPDDLDDHVAALSEPMAVCVRAVRLGGVGVGDRVAVLRGGQHRPAVDSGGAQRWCWGGVRDRAISPPG